MRFNIRKVLVVSVLSRFGVDAAPEAQQQPLQTPSETYAEFDPEFNAFVEETLREWHVPGLSIAVIDDGVVYARVRCPL